MSGIERSRVREKLREADSELDTAVEQGAGEQAKYWVGRKAALKDLLDDTQDADSEHLEVSD